MKESNNNSKKADNSAPFSSADLPMGLSFALARNVNAMRAFSEMPDEKRQEVIDGARRVRSKKEMKEYVNNIVE